MRLVEDAELITMYQSILEKKLFDIGSERIKCYVGYKGGSHEAEVVWSDKHGIWYYPRKLDKKYWNAFGVTKPKEGKGISITAEINFPLGELNRSMNSAFVGNDGKIFIVHRGRMGGGRIGVDQELFRSNYTGDWYEFFDGDKVSTGALVASLSSNDFVNQITQFVKEYNRIKSINASSLDITNTMNNDGENDSYFKEFWGKRKGYTVSDIIEANCNHGIVVDECKEYLNRKGYSVKNDVHRDLVLVDSMGKERAVFEFKTDTSTRSIYCAIGQLLLHKRDHQYKTKYIMVLPDSDVSELSPKLLDLQIELITYRMNDDGVSFFNIDRVLDDIFKSRDLD